MPARSCSSATMSRAAGRSTVSCQTMGLSSSLRSLAWPPTRVSTPDPREAIADRDWLLRRIPDQPERMWTRKCGVLRPSSAALKPASQDRGMSVDVRRLLRDPSRPTSVLGDRADDGLVEFQAATPRHAGLDVIHTPLRHRYSHADV